MSNIKDKILTLVKMENPDNPLEYVQDVVRDYTLEKSKNEILTCNKCDLCKFGIKSIAFGKTDSKILIINESVSEEQFNSGNKIAFPLSDEDGETFKRALGVIKADINEMYMINAISCYPAKDDGLSIVKRIPSVVERNACKKHIDNIIKAINPEVIITLGSVAANSLSDTRISILTDRGNPFNYNGYYVMPTFHPSFFREMSNKFDEEMMNMYKDNFLVDLFTAFSVAKEKNSNCKIGDIKLPF